MLKNICTNINITDVNYKLTRGGCQKSYKIRNYKEIENKSIDKISRNR